MEHRDIPDSQLHEPKGAASAPANTVYVANGTGSGQWKDPPFGAGAGGTDDVLSGGVDGGQWKQKKYFGTYIASVDVAGNISSASSRSTMEVGGGVPVLSNETAHIDFPIQDRDYIVGLRFNSGPTPETVKLVKDNGSNSELCSLDVGDDGAVYSQMFWVHVDASTYSSGAKIVNNTGEEGEILLTIL